MSTAFGLGSPVYPTQTNPFAAASFGGYPSAFSTSGLQQQPILQSLQVIPQQLHQLQQLLSIQQQQIQQVLQIVPAQLQHLQQLIQLVPQQLHQVLQFVAQQQSSAGAQGLIGTSQLAQSQGFGAPLQTLSPFSPFVVSSGHVM